MKKIILCLLSIVALASCAYPEHKEIKFTDTEDMKVVIDNDQTTLRLYRVSYNGHSYIMFDGSNHLNGIVHDPNCACHKHNSSETDFGF